MLLESESVVSPAAHPVATVHAAAVHHRDFPEVRGEGQPPEDAAPRKTKTHMKIIKLIQ
jgi:hypothetical protein